MLPNSKKTRKMNIMKSMLAALLLLISTLSFAQSAGPAQQTCVRTDSVLMQATGTGSWVALTSNPHATVIHSVTSPTTYITGFTVPGLYGFVWDPGDTAFVTVKPLPARPILTERGGVCLGHDTLVLNRQALNTQIIWADGIWTMHTGINGYDTVYVPTVNWGGIYYSATIVDSNGCAATSDSVTVQTCAAAGPAQTICLGNTATMAATGTGSWTALSTNPFTATITTPSSPTTTITGFYVPGVYGFSWGTAHGDTVYITVPGIPAYSLALLGDCLGHDSIEVLNAVGADSIVWMLSGHPIAKTVATPP
jgi:hypothetical protein